MREFMPTLKRASTLLVTLALAVGLVGPSARAQEPAGDTVNAATTQAAAVALSTAIPYQGQLNTNGTPANGTHDFQFKLFDAASAGVQVGSTLVKEDVSVANGLFATELDFGATPFAGQARWLEIGVRAGASTGAFTTLSPRRPLLAVPYALYSLASAGGSGGNPAYGAAAGAPANAVYVMADGQMGIGTTTPGYPLELKAPRTGLLRVQNSGGPTAAIGIAADGISRLSFLTAEGKLDGSGTAGPIQAIEFNHATGLLALRTNNTNRLSIDQAGAIGIGTDTPGYPLELKAPRTGLLRVQNSGGPTAAIGIAADGISRLSFLTAEGKLDGSGTAGPIQAIEFNHATGLLALRTNNTNRLSINQSGAIGIGTDAPSATLDVAGTTRTNVLVIDAGSDLAEPFDINGAEIVESGMVVAIDPDNPGQLRLATAAYDRTVAGVVSGAGGINPGLILQQEGSVAAGEHPVALSGRVYVYADATNGAIAPGDLLTTSDTPGHAMKVTDHALAQGAILGKAMSRLADGTGLVLVLVTLQ